MLWTASLLGCSRQDQGSSLKSAAETPALHLNDVSVLFPYKDVPELLQKAPRISDRAADGQPFIPAEILAELDRQMRADHALRQREGGVFGQGASDPVTEEHFFEKAEPLQMASVRIDPCANALQLSGDKSRCQPQLRIIWQGFQSNESGFRAGTDINLHAIYKLSTEDFAALVAQLRRLKSSVAGDDSQAPLGPHPIMKSEGAGSAYFEEFLAIVGGFAQGSRLSEVAAFGDTAFQLGGQWPMLALHIDGSALQPAPLVAVELGVGETPKLVQRMAGFEAIIDRPTPEGTALAPLYVKRSSEAEEIRQRKVYVGKLLELEDPRRHSVGNTDCASCHSARLEIDNAAAFPGGSKDPIASYENSRWNLQRIKGVSTLRTSLQMFSFFGGKYAIKPRVIHESAEVVDLIEELYSR